MHTSLIKRASQIRTNANYLPPAGFFMRKAYFADKKEGILRKKVEVDPMDNPMMKNPNGMFDM